MTDADPATRASAGDSRPRVDPGTAEGRSRILLFGGLGCLAVGNLVDASLVVWGGVGVVVLAFVLNTAGKLVHYGASPSRGATRSTSLPPSVCSR